jgi:hypothetical protein
MTGAGYGKKNVPFFGGTIVAACRESVVISSLSVAGENLVFSEEHR